MTEDIGRAALILAMAIFVVAGFVHSLARLGFEIGVDAFDAVMKRF
jgi:hypothetical protein